MAIPVISLSSLLEKSLPKLAPFYETQNGAAYLSEAENVLSELPDACLNLIFTSPPYALHFKKEYGNVHKDEYVQWFLGFAKEFFRCGRSVAKG